MANLTQWIPEVRERYADYDYALVELSYSMPDLDVHKGTITVRVHIIRFPKAKEDSQRVDINFDNWGDFGQKLFNLLYEHTVILTREAQALE